MAEGADEEDEEEAGDEMAVPGWEARVEAAPAVEEEEGEGGEAMVGDILFVWRRKETRNRKYVGVIG